MDEKYKEGFITTYKYWYLQVSFRQHTLASLIISCRENKEQLVELTDEELLELREIMQKLQKALLAIPEIHPDRFNYLQLGNNHHQLHIHCLPRYAAPRAFAGREWIDETWGHAPKWIYEEADIELVKELRDLIRMQLEKEER